jgi:hypothetical protein
LSREKCFVGHFLAFADESGNHADRFAGFAIVSLPASQREPLEKEVSDAAQRVGVRELKWNRLNSKDRSIAVSRLLEVVSSSVDDGLRIDVLVWDHQDARHAIPGRDLQANAERMFFHLAATSFARRPGSTWEVYPDKRSGTDWWTIESCLRSRGRWKRPEAEFLFDQFSRNDKFKVRVVSPVESHQSPLVQLADLFAGLATFSRRESHRFKTWVNASSPQAELPLFQEELRFGAKESARFPLITKTYDLCRDRGFCVSLNRRGYLWSPHGEDPINFWHWESQSPLDRAPKR